MTDNKGRAVITGASSGIGSVYADRLAARGYDLILIARSTGKLEDVAARIRARSGRKVDIFPADLTDSLDVARVEQLLKTEPNLSLLVNNAGFGGVAPLLQSDADDMSAMISLNVDALMRLTYAVAPQFVARKAGAIVNIASVVGITPEQLNGVYGGTKAFVIAFTQSLQKELEGTGVAVQAVLPGATATDFWDVSGGSLEQLPGDIVMSAHDLVDAALVGLDRGETVTIPALQDAGLWDAYDGARRAMFGKLSNKAVAPRYLPAA